MILNKPAIKATYYNHAVITINIIPDKFLDCIFNARFDRGNYILSINGLYFSAYTYKVTPEYQTYTTFNGPSFKQLVNTEHDLKLYFGSNSPYRLSLLVARYIQVLLNNQSLYKFKIINNYDN